MRAASSFCSSSSTACSALSISVSTSPMPRMRDAIQLRHEDAVERDALLERQRDVHRFLAGHRVEHEQPVGGLRRRADTLELLHQLLVDVQAAGGVEDDRVGTVLRQPLDAVADDGDGIRAVLAVDRYLDLATELLELVDRGGALKVGGDQTGIAPLLAEQQRQLRRGRRLARSLEPGEQDHRRRTAGEGELRAAGAHQRRQLLVDGPHDLLAGSEALQHLLAEGALAHLRDEILDDLEVDVGLEQREPDLAHRTRDRLLVELSAPPKVAERALKPV